MQHSLLYSPFSLPFCQFLFTKREIFERIYPVDFRDRSIEYVSTFFPSERKIIGISVR